MDDLEGLIARADGKELGILHALHQHGVPDLDGIDVWLRVGIGLPAMRTLCVNVLLPFRCTLRLEQHEALR